MIGQRVVGQLSGGGGTICRRWQENCEKVVEQLGEGGKRIVRRRWNNCGKVGRELRQLWEGDDMHFGHAFCRFDKMHVKNAPRE